MDPYITAYFAEGALPGFPKGKALCVYDRGPDLMNELSRHLHRDTRFLGLREDANGELNAVLYDRRNGAPLARLMGAADLIETHRKAT